MTANPQEQHRRTSTTTTRGTAMPIRRTAPITPAARAFAGRVGDASGWMPADSDTSDVLGGVQ